MEKPTGKRLPTALPQTLEIDRADFHIPSAPTASMNQFQIPKGQNPLRRSFASFRLIFRLEKTCDWVATELDCAMAGPRLLPIREVAFESKESEPTAESSSSFRHL